MTTDILALNEISQSQSGKEITHNAALRQLEAMLVRVTSRSSGGEPGSPSNGQTYIIDEATGSDWSANGNVGDIAYYYGGAWYYYSPIEGLLVHVNDEDIYVKFDGTVWTDSLNLPASAIYITITGALTSSGDLETFLNNLEVTKQERGEPYVVPEYTVADLPSAATWQSGIITVSDEMGGYTMAFSDGTNWRRSQDRAVVS